MIAFFLLAAMAAGCSQSSYPTEKIKESLLEICRKEYGIEELDVKIAGETIGVYLPLSKLFAADFQESAVTGKVRNLETLFEPAPEAMEKVEDVLFSISRVLLSTERPLKFYILEATDVEKTGMQLVLTGFVDDIKRVRIWDISRNEYRKRVVHELRLNRAVLWHKPVRRFFQDLELLTAEELGKKYFGGSTPLETIQTLFFDALSVLPGEKSRTRWEVLGMKSVLMQRNEVLVYARVKPHRSDASAEGVAEKELEYFFLLSLAEEEAQIVRIIPFQYQDDYGHFQKVPLPPELAVDQNFDHWEEEFPVEDVKLGPFLAGQLTRRLQAVAATDERIQNTFREVKINFEYQEEPPPPHFSLNLEASLKDFNHYSRESLVYHEDMLYLLNLVSREFVEVLRSYQFGDYDYLSLNVVQEPSAWVFDRESLELFRRKKIDLQGLLSLPKI